MNIQKTTRASKPPKTKSIFGFTLIELIVVITILAILGTIGFLSIGGYSSKARDSSRISDVANISKSLDVSIITVGTYPTPDNSFAVTYSWGTIWNQGTISTNVLQVLRTSIAWGGLSKKPVDPLDNSEYEYSSLAFGKAYQIKAEYEGDLNQTAYELSTPSFTEEVQAAPGAPSIAYIKGNYGGLVAKTVTGSMTYILAIPSMMSSTGSANAILRIESNHLSGALLFNGMNLKNASLYNPTTIVFTGSWAPANSTEALNVAIALQNAYSGANNITSNQAIANLLATPTVELASLARTIVNNQLGGTIENASITYYSGACTGLPATSVYFNNTTSYSVSGATTLSALTAGNATNPLANTCQFKCNGTDVWNGSACVEAPLYAFTSHTFTNCGATGRIWPTLANCQSAYSAQSWASNTAYFNQGSYQGYQLWTVPATGSYSFAVRGAQGWNVTLQWGYGAILGGTASLTKGENLIIIVGQQGNSSLTYGQGGGGWSFVVKQTGNTRLVIAWGGGGAGASDYNTSGCSLTQAWANASTTNNGVSKSCYDSVSGGTGGGGGGAGTSGTYTWHGGGGFNSSGSNGTSGGIGGGNFSNWFQWGYGWDGINWGRHWGFGGGGGGNPASGGGGGGYSGGAGGAGHWSTYSTEWGGGGSFSILTSPTSSVSNTGHGSVVITKL